MQIGAVAKSVGMTTSAIRYYERRGLIQPVGRVSGRREFDELSVLTLRFLKRVQAAGFTLAEAQRLFKMGFGDERPQADWQGFLHTKRLALQRQIEEVQRMDCMLEQFEKCACPSLADCMTDTGDEPPRKGRA